MFHVEQIMNTEYKPIDEFSNWSYHYEDALLTVRNLVRDVTFYLPCYIEETQISDVAYRVVNTFEVGYARGRIDEYNRWSAVSGNVPPQVVDTQ